MNLTANKVSLVLEFWKSRRALNSIFTVNNIGSLHPISFTKVDGEQRGTSISWFCLTFATPFAVVWQQLVLLMKFHEPDL